MSPHMLSSCHEPNTTETETTDEVDHAQALRVLGDRVMPRHFAQATIDRIRRMVEGAEADARNGTVPDPVRWVSTTDVRVLLDAYDAATGNGPKSSAVIHEVRD